MSIIGENVNEISNTNDTQPKNVKFEIKTNSKRSKSPATKKSKTTNELNKSTKQPKARKSHSVKSIKSNVSVDFDITKLSHIDKDYPDVNINPIMEIYMKNMMNAHKNADIEADEKFNNSRLDFLNAKLKPENKYILDKYNLAIKRNEFNKTKTAFGWVYDDVGDPINIHINPNLLETKSSDITFITLQQLKVKYPTLFQNRGVMYKIYTHERDIGIDVGML